MAFAQEVGDLEVGCAVSQLRGDKAVLVPLGGSRRVDSEDPAERSDAEVALQGRLGQPFIEPEVQVSVGQSECLPCGWATVERSQIVGADAASHAPQERVDVGDWIALGVVGQPEVAEARRGD